MRWTRQALVFTSLCWLGCVGEPVPVIPDNKDPEPTPEGPAIDNYVESLPKLPTEPSKVIEGDRSAARNDGSYSCSTQNLKETRQYDKIVAYSANSEQLWPGALIAGDSVYSGFFTQVVFPRQPLNISVSLENLAGPKSATLDQPSLSSFREALTRILQVKVSGSTPANIYSEIEQVHSERQLALALGAEVSWLGSAATVKSSFDFMQSRIRSRYLVRYTQAYYTVDIDQPGRPSDFFTDAVTAADVQARLGSHPPVFVSSVTYGRMVIFTFESEYSSDELSAALEFAYTGGIAASAEVAATYKKIISESKITASILGGSGKDGAKAIKGYESLMEYIGTGGDYTRESPGAPIAYKLAYLADNQPARLSLTTEYTLKQCDRVGQKVKATLKNIRVIDAGGDHGKDLELFGSIWVTGDTAADLFLRSESGAITIAQGAVWPQSGFISDRVVDVTPQSSSVIRVGANIWDDDGILGVEDLSGDRDQAVQTIQFDAGWRRDVVLRLTGAGTKVEITVGLEPL